MASKQRRKIDISLVMSCNLYTEGVWGESEKGVLWSPSTATIRSFTEIHVRHVVLHPRPTKVALLERNRPLVILSLLELKKKGK